MLECIYLYTFVFVKTYELLPVKKKDLVSTI